MIYRLFDSIPDHRVTGRCIYPLGDLLVIALLSMLCGGEGYTEMSAFASARAKGLGLLKDCGGNSPSPDTFERLFRSVSPAHIERCLVEHGRKFLDSLCEKQVVIDGKKLCGTSPKSKAHEGLYLLNAFVSENHIMVGQVPLMDKENEITAIPRLLDQLDLTDAVVSIDAIGTQTSIAQSILDRGAHYFLAVKDNQKTLNETVKDAFKYGEISDVSSEMEADHGRIEERRCRIAKASEIEDADVAERWPELKTVVEITSKVMTKESETTSVRRYISDEDFPQAAYYAMLARGHWGIENQLHWLLDVVFKEDACRARTGFAAQNLLTMRKIALQTVKGMNDKHSIRRRLFLAAISEEYLMKIIKSLQF